jgi:glycerol kinase
VTGLVLGLDQGTSSTRCLALDHDLAQRGAATVTVNSSFPGPGLVEQDPAELVASAVTAIDRVLAAANARPADVVALGIANQTETFVISDRASRRPLHPAIVWQDRRTADRCAQLTAAGHGDAVRSQTGLELDATFPATKIGWVLDHVDGARAAAERGELAYHDVAGWLVAHLCGIDIAEAGNAGRTLLCALGAADWDDGLLALFGVPRPLLPPIVDSDAVASGARVPAAGTAGARPSDPVLPELPASGVLGDQQASLFGLGCRDLGTAKVTLGTGAFLLAHGGNAPLQPPPGVLASCAWRFRGQASYALEGFIPAAGAALSWFAALGALPPAPQLEGLLAAAGPEDGSVACVPALQGLGTPGWDAGVRGALFGLSRATTRGQVARAVIDGVLHQVADALDAIRTVMPLEVVLLDGGLSRSDWIVQRLADIAQVRVERAARGEATAIGAAMMAGLAAGFWTGVEELPGVGTDLAAEPGWRPAEREARRRQWTEAVGLATRWRPDGGRADQV